MFGIICLLFALFCDYKDIYTGKGMSSSERYYGKFVADNDKIWYEHLRNAQMGKEPWNCYHDSRIKWEDKLNK